MTQEAHTATRRTVAKTAMWSAPVVAMASAAPAIAASMACPNPTVVPTTDTVDATGVTYKI